MSSDAQKQGFSLNLFIQDEQNLENSQKNFKLSSGFQDDFYQFLKSREKNKKMQLRLKFSTILLKPEPESKLGNSFDQFQKNLKKSYISLFQFNKSQKTFVKLRVWVDSIVVDAQKENGGLVLWLKSISLSSLNYMLEKVKRINAKTQRISLLLIPQYKQIITTNSLSHCVNISQLSKFDGQIQTAISYSNQPQIKITLSIEKAFFSFKKDSYLFFNHSITGIIESIKKQSEKKKKIQDPLEQNIQFFVQSSSKYETDIASLQSLQFQKAEAQEKQEKAKQQEKKAYGFEFVSSYELQDITKSQHAVLHETPGLLTDYITQATVASHPLQMSIHQETLLLSQNISGLSFGITVGQFYFKMSSGRDFRKSKGNFRDEFAFAKLENLAASFRIETETNQGQICLSIQELEVGDQEGNEVGMALGKENKLNPEPISILVVKFRHIAQFNRVMLRSSLNIQPLAFKIRQRFLMFLLQFFEVNLEKQEQIAKQESPLKQPAQKINESPLYLQKLRIEPISISLNYTSEKLLNLSSLSNGNILQILNLVNIRDLELKFTRYEKQGADIEQFLQQFATSLIDQISSNQKLSIVASVGPVRTIVNIGNAIIDLVAKPIQESSRKGVVRTFLTGVKDLGITLGREGTFLTTTTLSSLMSLFYFSKYEI